MIKKTYVKPLLKSFLIEPMDFLAASPNPKPTNQPCKRIYQLQR